MKKFHVFFISLLMYFQSVVFAEDEKSNEWDNSASPKAEFRGRFGDVTKTEESANMVDEFNTNLGQIQEFARNVKPLTTDIRRSMYSRRSFNEDNFFDLMRTASIKLLDTAERFAPAVEPILAFPRSLVNTFLTD